MIEPANTLLTWTVVVPTRLSHHSSALGDSNMALLTALFGSSVFEHVDCDFSRTCTSSVVGAWTSRPNSTVLVYSRSTGSILAGAGRPLKGELVLQYAHLSCGCSERDALRAASSCRFGAVVP